MTGNQQTMKPIDLGTMKEYFARQPDVDFAVLFGSAASGQSTAMSDIDIAVYFDEEKSKLEMGDRQIDITCAIMNMTHNNRVDIVVLNISDPFLCFQVVTKGSLLYAHDEKKYYHFKARSLGRYQDIRPMYEAYHRATEQYFRREKNS